MTRILLLAILCSGCIFRTAWIGDSNSAGLVVPKPTTLLDSLQPTIALGGQTYDAAWDDHAVIGATACDHRDVLPWAMDQVVEAVASKPQLVILAIGTNDVGRFDTPEALVACLDALCAVAVGPGGAALPCWVMTLPPVDPSLQPYFDITAYNAAILAHFPADRVLDGYTDMVIRDGAIHLDAFSEELRAERVAARFAP